MDKKRPLTGKQLNYYINLSDSESNEIFGEDGNNSSDYVPSEDSSEDSDDEVVSEPEGNHDASQATTSNPNNNLWTENQQHPELFIFQENIGLKLDTTNLTVQMLVDLFFQKNLHYFFRRIALLVEQTNLYAAHEIAKHKEIKKSEKVLQWKDVSTAEIKVFIGLVLQMGPCSFPSIEHYWSTNKLYNIMFW
ncbi:piggyBac transposable element-derived protein 4-like [Centruroides sculpturatus]|uniref:piggyBac transposable element-derived protein 4-like n=1 Tax=Centruroides sculpturatus TaxID=218467 RepID=UPI000C6E8C2D|nr:piggyBac transposable element-derived protein 4-like [Centruroides sculpturatus]